MNTILQRFLDHDIELRCNSCKKNGTLTSGENGMLSCTECRQKYRTHESCIDFLNDPEKEVASTRLEYDKLFSELSSEGPDPLHYYGKTIEEELAEFFGETDTSPDQIKGRTILDAGCGLARLSRRLSEMGAVVVAFDIHNLFDAFYRLDRINPLYLISSVSNVPVPDQVFDMVWCQGVLCYTSDPGKGILELQRVLKPGGKICLWIQNTEKLGPVFRLARWARGRNTVLKGLSFLIGGTILTGGHMAYNLIFRKKLKYHQGFLNFKDWMSPETIADFNFKDMLSFFPKEHWHVVRAKEEVFTKLLAIRK
jgi:SAM-dependent methyltransferase